MADSCELTEGVATCLVLWCAQLKVLGVVFGEEDQLVTCGINHIFFWSKEGRGQSFR